MMKKALPNYRLLSYCIAIALLGGCAGATTTNYNYGRVQLDDIAGRYNGYLTYQLPNDTARVEQRAELILNNNRFRLNLYQLDAEVYEDSLAGYVLAEDSFFIFEPISYGFYADSCKLLNRAYYLSANNRQLELEDTGTCAGWKYTYLFTKAVN